MVTPLSQTQKNVLHICSNGQVHSIKDYKQGRPGACKCQKGYLCSQNYCICRASGVKCTNLCSCYCMCSTDPTKAGFLCYNPNNPENADKIAKLKQDKVNLKTISIAKNRSGTHRSSRCEACETRKRKIEELEVNNSKWTKVWINIENDKRELMRQLEGARIHIARLQNENAAMRLDIQKADKKIRTVIQKKQGPEKFAEQLDHLNEKIDARQQVFDHFEDTELHNTIDDFVWDSPADNNNNNNNNNNNSSPELTQKEIDDLNEMILDWDENTVSEFANL